MKIEIPKGCYSCRFFSETEDGEAYCAIYNKEWQQEEDSEGDKPEWCKAKTVEVIE